MTKITGYLRQVRGLSMAGRTSSNHWVMIDGPEEFYGSNAAIRPKELLLLSLAGCTGSDVVAILQKKRAKVEAFEMNIEAEQTDEHPKVYKRIDMEFVVYGRDIKEKDVARAIELSETKYCGVTAMLKNTVEINSTFRIVDTTEGGLNNS